MGTTAVALVAASVLLHVLWNAVAKNRPSNALFFAGNLIGAIALSPVIGLHFAFVNALPAAVWGILVCTGLAQTVYCLALARAYREEALSIVYPLVRSLGPAFVVLGSFALGRGNAIGWACVVGVASIFAGSAGLALSNLRALGRRGLPSAGILFCVLSALGTMAYTLLDDAGVRLIAGSGVLQPLGESALRSGLLYGALEAWTTTLGIGLALARTREHREEIRAHTSPAALRDATIMGLGTYASYSLVLVAMLYAADVSYVAAFRQLSIPLGAAVGVVWFGEHLDLRKLAGLLAMLGGLVLIAVV